MRAVALLLLACRSLQAQTARTLDLLDGTLPVGQRLIAATQGETLRWRITSNRAGVLHLHAYHLSLALQSGTSRELEFTAHAAGRFRLEWHAAAQGASIADGTAGGAHYAPPLAVLEVQPR